MVDWYNFMKNLSKTFLCTAMSSLYLTACGGSGAKTILSSPLPDAPIPTSTNIVGKVTAGYAQCNINAADLSGAPIGAEVRSNQQGDFNLDVGTHTGALLITASSCTYVDPVTNVTFVDAMFRSFVMAEDYSSTETTSDIAVQITPFTELAVRHAELLAGSEALTNTSLTQANTVFAPVFNRMGFDYRGTTPILPTDTDALTAAQDARDYGLALAALSGAGGVEGLTQDISLQGATLTEDELFGFVFNDLKDGAAIFEITEQNISGESSVELVLSSLSGNGETANTLAPIASVDNFVINVETALAPNRPIVWETLFSDSDSPDGALEYVILGEICGQSVGAMSELVLTCDVPGSYSFFVAAVDPDGNVTVIPATANINLPLTDTKASAFLMSSTFGPTLETIENLEGQGYSEWFKTQYNLPVNSILDGMGLPFADTSTSKWETVPRERWYERALLGDDQLRQRAAFALSQIFVISTSPRDLTFKSHLQAKYMDTMQNHAFGNYRDLMQDVTYSPLMGVWLTYIGNQKADATTGGVPDENYAREIMQLFTIGLVELNPDGTPKLDANGQEIEVYTNNDITELAKVFTGLWWANTPFGVGLGRPAVPDIDVLPMEMTESEHSPFSKSFLGQTVPAGLPGDQSISMALDILFEHPNLAPFVCKQLIQRMTTSNPSPAYVKRVVEAFETGAYTLPDGEISGTGTRGDLAPVWAAILLDNEALDLDRREDETFGKVREPIVRFLHWARYANVSSVEVTNDAPVRNGATTASLGQTPYRSSSVFNFFRPGFVAGGTKTASAGLVAPEMQITHTATAITHANFMATYVFRSSNQNWGGNYADALAVSGDTEAVIDQLDLVLTAGRMSDATRQRVSEVYESVTAPSDGIRLATQLIVMSPEYTTQH